MNAQAHSHIRRCSPRPRVCAAIAVCALLMAFTSMAHAMAAPVFRFPPSVSSLPASLTVELGQTTTLTVLASSDTAVNYLWLKDGNGLPGKTGAAMSVPNVPGQFSITFTIPNTQLSDAGDYSVVVSNNNGSTVSNTASLTIIIPVEPSIRTQPVSANLEPGQGVTLSVGVDGVPTPSLQWRKNGAAISGETSKLLLVGNVTTADSGNYDVVATNRLGSATSAVAVVTVAAPVAKTTITAQPGSMSMNLGASASFTSGATGKNLHYQWKKNGVAVAGATNPTYTVSGATAADMGFYSIVVSGDGGAVESKVVILTVAVGGTSRLSNLSTRGLVQPGGDLTVGIVTRGEGGKSLLVRAVGPTLGTFGVPNALANPKLELIPAGSSVAMSTNDDWGGDHDLVDAAEGVGAFALSRTSRDSALLATLTGAGYSARITSAAAGDSGLALAEVYDRDGAGTPNRLINVSTRGFVGSGADALASGFVIGGNAPKQLLIRAVGPGLTAFGIGGVLADPQIAIVPIGQSFTVASNDNWDGSSLTTTAFAQAGAFALAPGSKDAALVVRLPPGGYSVVVTGANNTTGTALVEIYDLDP